MVSQHGTFTSYQVNVDANGLNITGDAANEPSIAVDPTNQKQDDDRLEAVQQRHLQLPPGRWGYTTNGGTSWTFPGVLENNVFRSDPVLVSDDTGRFFYLSLLETFFDDMWRSLNGGQTWTNLATRHRAATSSGSRSITPTASATASNTSAGARLATISAARQFSRSTDGGFTWINPINIPNTPVGNARRGHERQPFYRRRKFGTGQFWCNRSTNAKNGAVTPTFDQSTPVDLGGDHSFLEPINPDGLVGQVFLAVDRSGTSTNNNVYMLASVQPTGVKPEATSCSSAAPTADKPSAPHAGQRRPDQS